MNIFSQPGVILSNQGQDYRPSPGLLVPSTAQRPDAVVPLHELLAYLSSQFIRIVLVNGVSEDLGNGTFQTTFEFPSGYGDLNFAVVGFCDLATLEGVSYPRFQKFGTEHLRVNFFSPSPLPDDAVEVYLGRIGTLELVVPYLGYVEFSTSHFPGVGELATINEVSSAPVVNKDKGHGSNAIYSNAGSIGGQAFDLRVEVIGGPLHHEFNFSDTEIGIQMVGGDEIGELFDLRFTLYQAGTNIPVDAPFGLLFQDIDANGAVIAKTTDIVQHFLSDPTNLVMTTSGDFTRFDGTVNGSHEPEQEVGMVVQNLNGFEVSIKKEFWGSGYSIKNLSDSQFELVVNAAGG